MYQWCLRNKQDFLVVRNRSDLLITICDHKTVLRLSITLCLVLRLSYNFVFNVQIDIL